MSRKRNYWAAAAFLLTFGFTLEGLHAQVYTLADTSIVSCSGTLFDTGGPNAPYSNDEFLAMTIEAGGIVTISFSSFSLHSGADTLFVFDSNDGSGVVHILTGSDLPDPITIFTGAFTVVMQSDEAFISSGFIMHWESDVPLPAAPNITVGTAPACNAAQLSLQLQPPLSCTILDDAYATLIFGDTSVVVNNINTNCVGGSSGFITLNLDAPLSNKCDYIIQLHLQLPDACGNIRDVVTETALDFNTTCALDAQIVTEQNQICAGTCIELSAIVNSCHALVYSWSGGLLGTAGPHQLCPDSTTTISLTVTDLVTLEVVTRELVITVNPSNILNVPEEVCQNATPIQLITSTTGVWSGPGVQGNLFNPALSGPGEIALSFQGPLCSDTIVYTVNPISLNDQAACPNAPAFQVVSSPAGGVWSGDVSATGVFSPSPAGSYQVTYEVEGCSAQAIISVANLDLQSNVDTICQSVEVVELTATPTGGFWSGVGVLDASGIFRPELASPNQANTVTYTASGCSSNISIFVVAANVDSLVSVCPSQSPLIPDATPIPGGGVWSSPFDLILDPSSGLINPSALEGLETAYMVYVPGNGCFDTLYLQVSVTDIPEDYLGVCLGEDALALNEELFPGLSPANGIWTGTGVQGNAISGYSLNVASLNAGEYEITYSANGCTDNLTLGVWISDLPNTDFSFCLGDTLEELIPGLFCSTCVGPQASWQGAGIIDNTLGIFDPDISGIGVFHPVWISPAGCSDSVSVTVLSPETPVISGLFDSYCSGNQLVSFTATPAGGQLLGDVSTFQFNVQSLSPGEYQVIYAIDGICASSAGDTAFFQFDVLPPIDVTLQTNATSLCYGESLIATATVSGGLENTPIQYSWNYGGSNASEITITPTVDITLVVTVDDGCSGSASDNIDVETSDEIVFDFQSSDTLCKGEQGFLRLLIDTSANYTILWNNLPEPDNQVNAPAGTEFAVSITDAIGCRADSSVTIPAYTTGIASFSLENSSGCLLFAERTNVQFLDLSADAISGNWDFGDSTTQAYQPGIGAVHTYADAGFYMVHLSVESSNGCSTEDSVLVCIQPEDPIFIPDIFSPNSDGKNDTLYVRGFQIKRMDFKVFNRWGELVFFTDNPTVGWLGDHRGMPAASGSYFYQLMVVVGERDKILKTGEIILVR